MTFVVLDECARHPDSSSECRKGSNINSDEHVMQDRLFETIPF